MKFKDTVALFAVFGILTTGTLLAKSEKSSPKRSSSAHSAKSSSAKKPSSKKVSAKKPSPKAASRKTPRSRRPVALTSRGGFRTDAIRLPEEFLSSNKAILIQKSAKRLTLFKDGRPAKTYLATIGRNESADKERAGDWATPEGLYYVRRKNPASKYYLALHISYPNNRDAEQGLAEGLISASEYEAIVNANNNGVMPPQDTRLGYYIEIHGGSNRVVTDEDGQPQLSGWTRGCIGLRNQDIREIYNWAPEGTPVFIVP